LVEIRLFNPDAQLYSVHTDLICLSDYPEDETILVLSFFGYTSVDQVRDEWGDAANQIISECIFEHYGPIALEPLVTGLSFEQAQSFIDNYIKER